MSDPDMITKEQFESEIAYLNMRHEEKCAMLIKELNFWRARYDEIFNTYLSKSVQEKRIRITLSKEEFEQFVKASAISVKDILFRLATWCDLEAREEQPCPKELLGVDDTCCSTSCLKCLEKYYEELEENNNG